MESRKDPVGITFSYILSPPPDPASTLKSEVAEGSRRDEKKDVTFQLLPTMARFTSGVSSPLNSECSLS